MTITDEEFLHQVGVRDDVRPEPAYAPVPAKPTPCTCAMNELHAIERDRLRTQIAALLETSARLEAEKAQLEARCRILNTRWGRVAWAGWTLASFLAYARISG